eukprot:gnl/TRDRNA2_/TRDRNA2_142791_c0_seq1.p1 gnl/TRDRNA2_/TRDRNA2_142791_c0~~gnl/TRDRNA2_/TRDRNA2_142791_c0_seq1.p1  ORF type:complete len:360 (+),score=50.78 gnl/TRDRNA2_/TRDRNA2_142791_c0_seq1:148-1080(+)
MCMEHGRVDTGDTLPASAIVAATTETEMLRGTEAYDSRHTRRLRKLAEQQQKFLNSFQQRQDVEALLREVREATDAGDGLRLCRGLLRGVACLAKPRLKTQRVEGHKMTEEAKEQLKAALQTKIRIAILTCLQGLDLRDAGTRQRSDVQVSLGQLKRLLEGVALDQVKSSKQWIEIAALIATCGCQESDTCAHGMRHGQETGMKRRQVTPRASASLKIAMIEALRTLDGEATGVQLAAKMRSDPQIWSKIESTVNRQNSRSNLGVERRFRAFGDRPSEAWEANVINNMRRYCVDTGRRSPEGLKIWCLNS